ncbi:hypothetical protein LINPERPRIM_LOCUS4265 [Linum perenne]
MKFGHSSDDPSFVKRSDIFNGDEELRLRVIHYRRIMKLSGGFDADCIPDIGYLGPRPIDHFRQYRYSHFDEILRSSVKFVFDTYREKVCHEYLLPPDEYYEEPDLSPDAPTPLRYGNVRCKRCRQLAELKLQSKPDDDEYVYRNDDFFGDEELRLRVIHYRRTMWQNGVCLLIYKHREFVRSFHKPDFEF